jgi:hypothetical protein
VPLKIYTNENISVAIAKGLQRHGVEAWSARDVGNQGWSDEEQLAYASREHAVIFTRDDDFLRIARQWAREGKEHWGIIYTPGEKYGIGERLRRLLEEALLWEAEEMRNWVMFL